MPAMLTNNDQDAEDDNGEIGGERGGRIKYACHAHQ